MYGITETTVHVTYCPLSSNDLKRGAGSIVGRPIPDLQVYMLDDYLQLVPTGVKGQMFVAGAGLARGYLGHPDLTAERFRPNPFDLEGGARLYRSGDLARYRRDGRMEYLGRTDDQVKIRGFRIELGEIESVITQHPLVREVAVIQREDSAGEKRVVAYVVMREGEEGSVGEVVRYMRERMPEYMVPGAVVKMEQMPMTANGKLDRRALPAPGTERPDLQVSYAAPATPTEEILAAIWNRVLNVNPVGVDDNFFALGGDSIRAIQVLGLAKERGLQFSLIDIFRHSTIRDLADEVAHQATESMALEPTAPFGLIPSEDRLKLPDHVEDAYPLTLLQSGMFYHMQLTPDVPVYHNVLSMRLEGEFHPDLLQIAARLVVARNPVLRTSFDFANYSEPLQLVHGSSPFAVQFEDLRNLSEHEQVQIIEDYKEQEKNDRFDPSLPTLVRIRFHRLDDEMYQWTFTDSHTILDGWSVTMMMSEVFDYYSAMLKNEPLPEPEPRLWEFRDYVRLERLTLQDEAARRYWSERLYGTTPTHLPYSKDGHRQGDSLNIREVQTELSPEIAKGLQRLVSAEAIPLHYLLLTAHVKVLGLITGRTDVITGLTLDCRLEAQSGTQTLGLYLNTIPFRVELQPGTWAELAHNVFNAALSMLPYRRYPMAAIQKEWGLTPLYEATFNLVSFHNLYSLIRSGLVRKYKTSANRNDTSFPLLAFFVLDQYSGLSDAGLTMSLFYDSNRMDESQMQALNRYYIEALSRLAADPSSHHNHSSLLSSGEYDLLISRNRTDLDYPKDECLHHLFERQAQVSPDALALKCGQVWLSYQELNRRANQLAHYLIALGIGPEVRVAICMDRSSEMMIALLAVLKSGGAYVPLDPGYPSERLAFMIEDSQAPVLLTQSHIGDRLPNALVQYIELDREWDTISGYDTSNPVVESSSENLAYLIYTSGSTGRPKGVMVTHRGLSNYAIWAAESYRVRECSGSLVHSSISFDLTITGLFVPLLRGAAVTLVDETDAVAAVATTVDISDGNTLVKLTPGQLDLIRAQLTPERASQFAAILVIGGEALTCKMLKFWQQHAPRTRLINEYGPTETVVGCCVYEARPEGPSSGAVPIGQPIANTRLYVMDGWGNMAPQGAVGELYIGGAGLARGYCNQGGLTAERFVPDAYSAEHGARLYRTGDKVKWRADGELEYIGRMDDQVKIRGFRIELGEIESVITQHPLVREVAVIQREDSAGEKRVVAYVVMREGEEGSVGEVVKYIRERVPEYMVPGAVVKMEQMPMTANGKLDRRALPEPDRAGLERQVTYEPPRTPTEEVLAEICSRAIGIDRVGIFDNFFQIGGHSLAAVRVIAQVCEAFHIDLPLSTLFQTPTIAALGERLDTIGWLAKGRVQIAEGDREEAEL
jgi:amino acid adenylation domain-containing protein